MNLRFDKTATYIALVWILLSCACSSFGDTARPAPGDRKAITINEIEFAFRWCPPGEFLMGSPEDRKEQYADSFTPQHRVRLTRGFWLQETELTQAQYKMAMGENPSFWQGPIRSNDPVFDRRHTDDNPVERVSWKDAAAFCEKLSKLDEGRSYRLPTEAEWEHACRAGKPECRYGPIMDIAWVFENTDAGNGSIGHMSVGRKTPNAWGLHDILGNVSEWCSDWSGELSLDLTIDPTGPETGEYRTARGGDCFADRGEFRTEGLCLAGPRGRSLPDYADRTRGFRVVMITGDVGAPPQREKVSAPNSITPGVKFEIPEKDKACLPDGNLFLESFVQLGDKERGLNRGLAWRSSVLGKQVQAEGIAWFGRIVMDGTDIRLRGVEYAKADHGKLVRVVGTLRYDQGSWSRFGTVPPFFFLQADSYTVIDRVEHPVLACYDESVAPIRVNKPKPASKARKESSR